MANPAKRAKGLLFLALFMSIVGFSILFPIVAPLSRSLGLSEVEVGWLSTSYSLTQFFGGPYFGILSERIGRKPVLLIGVFGFALGFAAFGTVAHLGVSTGCRTSFSYRCSAIGARVLGGMLSSATLPAAQAYIADVTERHERTSGMALVGAAFGLGLIFGPVIGAVLSRFGLLTPISGLHGRGIVQRRLYPNLTARHGSKGGTDGRASRRRAPANLGNLGCGVRHCLGFRRHGTDDCVPVPR